MVVARQLIVLALDHAFGAREGVVISGVVDIEMRADEDVDVAGAQRQISEMFQDVFLVFGGRGSGRLRYVLGHSAVDQDVLAVRGFDEIAG